MAKNCVMCNKKLGLFEKIYQDKYCKECYDKQVAKMQEMIKIENERVRAKQEEERKKQEEEQLARKLNEEKLLKEKKDSFRDYFLYTDFFYVIIKIIDNVPFHYNDIFSDSIKNKFDIIMPLLNEMIKSLPQNYTLKDIKELTTYRNESKIISKVLKFNNYVKRDLNSEKYCLIKMETERCSKTPNNNVLDDIDVNILNSLLTSNCFVDFESTINYALNNSFALINNYQKYVEDYMSKANNDRKYDTSKCIAFAKESEMEQTYEIINIYYFYAIFIIYYAYYNRIIDGIINNSELYKVYSKLKNEIHNDSYIVEKLYPIYNSLYRKEFEIEFEEETDFKLLIEMIQKKEKEVEKNDYKSIEENILNINIENFINMDGDDLLYELTRVIENNIVSYKKYISLEEIINMFIYSREEVNIYNKVQAQKAVYEKERILNGIFDEEKKVVSNSLDYSTIDNGYDFESFVANLYKMLGYNVEAVTAKSGDQGADVIIEKDNIKYAIQVKYYNNPVGNKAVQEVVAAKSFYKTDKAMVVTNSTFTPQAITLANANDVLLVDGNKLDELIKEAKNK
ncbi:MAG: restriction endonuclease [Clostridia bacterium]|nr:restriction endonuclease [Clostridia bacterium]